MDQVIVVVGDRFEGFIENNTGVMGIGDLERRLSAGSVPDGTRIVVGQGLSTSQLRELRRSIAATHPRVRLDVDERWLEPASQRLTHKRQAKNVMLSTPECVESGRVYESLLVLDDDCAEMSDHVTGQHLQGMVLIEAARQMFLAVTERFFPRPEREKSYFVINDFTTTFFSFTFPLQTTVRYTVLEHRADPKAADSFEALVAFGQHDVRVARSVIAFTAYPDAYIAEREAAKARQVLERCGGTPLAKAG
jgi:hypothetical protein